MDDYLIDSNRIQEGSLQRPNVYNRYSPFYEIIKQQSAALFDEIRENLSRTIQFGELEPGFSIWSNKLKRFISLYGFSFTKIDHLKLINFYLSILSISDLNYVHVQLCFDVLYTLLRPTHLLTRDDLTIDWRIFYGFAQVIFAYEEKICRLITLPEGIRGSLDHCVQSCSPYFLAAATQEILDEFRPQICPVSPTFNTTMKMLELFLPVILPADFHHQGFKLWLSEFFTLWESLYNKSAWELFLMMIFSSLAWHNIGYIDWQPWLSQIFTRLLRGFSLPIGKMQVSSQEYTYFVTVSSKWIVSMIGNGSACLQYLRDLLFSVKSFYHPSNTEYFQEDLVDFVVALARDFLERVHLERRTRPFWHFIPAESYRLTEDDITDFVNCVKEYVFISIFNKNYDEEAAEACQYLSILRPELIVPPLIEKHFSAIENLTEPHRLISMMSCLKHIARQIVQQTPSYSSGQLYVVPLLMSVLPAIDLNDMEKTFATLDFLETILVLITCVDCSSVVATRNDLTEIEKEVCLSTSKFEDFIIEFLNRIFDMVETLSSNMSDAVTVSTDLDIIDLTIETKLTTILFNIVQHCSSEIFQKVREKIISFAFGRCFSSNVRDTVSSLLEALVKGNPSETLKYFLPKTSESIEQILNNSESNEKENVELTWYLLLFAKLVHAGGDILLTFKTPIMSIFHQCIHLINKNSSEIIANAAKSLLESLTQLYPIDYRLTIENLDPPFVGSLPIRAWGKSIDYDKLQVQFHLPNDDEIDFATEFVDTFLYPELTFLNENNAKLSNQERLRSLTLIQSIATGCFRSIPRIESDPVQRMPSTVSFDSKYQIQYSIYFKELRKKNCVSEPKENLRMRLLVDIGKILDELIENHSDDVSSIIQALEFYSYVSIFYGLYEMSVKYSVLDIFSREKLLQNKLCSKGQHIRPLVIERMALQIQLIEVSQFGIFTHIDKEIVLKLFELSINRYSEIRERAQMELFNVLNSYPFSFEVIVDRIIQLLNGSADVDHDQIKGCLYILRGDSTFFFPTKYSWTMREKLWPAIAGMTHATKLSTQNLIEKIGNKMSDSFASNVIIQNTNEVSRDAAIDLWQLLKPSDEIKTREEWNSIDIQSYKNLMETLTALLDNDSLTWGQQNLTMSFLCLLLQQDVPIPLSCIEVFVRSLVHENGQLRQYAEKGLAAICHLQKLPRIFAEKILDEPCPTVLHDHPGDRDDNLWVTVDGYRPPQTQLEWEETCFLDQPFHGYYCWPKRIQYSINKRERYTLNHMPAEVAILYDRFSDRNFLRQVIELMLLDEVEDGHFDFNENRFAMCKGLFRNFGLAVLDNFMEELCILVRETRKEKQVNSHRVASEILAGIIRGSKYWTLEMLDELWEKLTPFLTEVWTNLNSETLDYWSFSFQYIIKKIDPRRMYRLLHFFHTLIDHKTTLSTTNEISRWTLIHRLNHFNWRIPSIWCEINKHARLLLDHVSEDVRYRITTVLSMSISFDIRLFNGQSTRHPNADEFIDDICQRLHQAIEVYEKTTLIDISDENIQMNSEARQAINLIETTIQMHTLFHLRSHQPIKNSIIRLFSYLCEMESITSNDPSFKEKLTISRLYIGMSYLNPDVFELLIQQLTRVCASPKWHARRAAIEFAQNMIFCNLFNARPHADRLHKLVLQCLLDEQLEVRIAASTTLSGFYQCGYMQVTAEDLVHFRRISKTSYVTKINGEKVLLSKNMIERHGGVLGLCAIVLSSPYDIPTYVPDALVLLCEHSCDPDLIQKSIKTCLSEFRRTHHDSWHEHREQFTEDQLAVLADVFISHSYYT